VTIHQAAIGLRGDFQSRRLTAADGYPGYVRVEVNLKFSARCRTSLFPARSLGSQ